MRLLLLVFAAFVLCGTVQAQVIKGESTDDAVYAPRPPARWHSPSRKVVRQVASTSAEGRERVAIEQGNGLGRGTIGAAFHHRLDGGRVRHVEGLAAA